MKTLKQLCAATSLLFVLSLSALAGNIHTDFVPPPPPPPASSLATSPGDNTNDGTRNPVESETLITKITLRLLRLLSMF